MHPPSACPLSTQDVWCWGGLRADGVALVDRAPSWYLWLKVWRPMEADAKNTDLQKLEV